jgi:hypothetical protein
VSECKELESLTEMLLDISETIHERSEMKKHYDELYYESGEFTLVQDYWQLLWVHRSESIE